MPFSVGGGESCLGAADVDFNKAARRQFRRRAMKATLAVHTGTREAQGRGRFLVGLWGLLYRADRYSAQGSTRERFFVENRMVKK